MFANRWLTYLAGVGFSSAEIIDLARPHTPMLSYAYANDRLGITGVR